MSVEPVHLPKKLEGFAGFGAVTLDDCERMLAGLEFGADAAGVA